MDNIVAEPTTDVVRDCVDYLVDGGCGTPAPADDNTLMIVVVSVISILAIATFITLGAVLTRKNNTKNKESK